MEKNKKDYSYLFYSYLYFKQRYKDKDVPYDVCPKCGANLDKGEICQDCKKNKEKENDGG